ncbi:NAD(P)H-dependent oxidoreductase, partial [Candidatus Omnitrophota bacterium]
GAGWFGRGLVTELKTWPGLEPRILFDRTIEKAVNVYLAAGIPKEKIVVADSVLEMHQAVKKRKYVVSNRLELMNDLSSVIDVFFEATGNILAGAESALTVFKQKIHFVTVNAEMDATIGFALNKIAQEHGVIYSNSDGDQPGVLARMITEVKLMGFEIAAAGNGKGFLNYHATPEDIMPFVPKGGSPRKITSFTDGSKQSLEMVVLANGMGLTVDKRGMNGVKTTKADLVADVTKQLKKDGVVEYVMGRDVNLGMTVFVIGKRQADHASRDLEYLKMGKGPYYLFFRDYHLCYFESPKSIAEVALFNKPTIFPQSLQADVLTVAKKDLKAGEKLDGIGGYTVYGLIDCYETVKKEKLLPLGLAEYAVMKCNVSKDNPITYDMVDFPEDNLVLQLRKSQDCA